MPRNTPPSIARHCMSTLLLAMTSLVGCSSSSDSTNVAVDGANKIANAAGASSADDVVPAALSFTKSDPPNAAGENVSELLSEAFIVAHLPNEIGPFKSRPDAYKYKVRTSNFVPESSTMKQYSDQNRQSIRVVIIDAQGNTKDFSAVERFKLGTTTDDADYSKVVRRDFMRDELQAREQLTTEKGAGVQAEASVTLANGRFSLHVVYRARPGADAMPFTELWKIIDETSLIDLMKLPVATHLSKEQLRALTAAKDAASALPSGDLLLPVVDVARISGCADATVADAKHKMPGSVTRYYRCTDRAPLLMIVTQPGAFDFDKEAAQNDAKSNMQLIPGLGTGAYSTNRDWTFYKSKQNHLSIELNHASARVSLQMITPEREKALINSRDQLIELARIVDANLTRLKK